MNHLSTFQEIYADNYRKMYRIALKMIGDRDIASDIVQDVFISLFHRFSEGKSILYLNTWLYRATINKCIDVLRKQKRFLSIESANNCFSYDESLEQKEAIHAVEKALSQLKPLERIVAVCYSEGLSYKEIAEASGVRFSSVGKMLSRVLEKLGNELKKKKYELS